MVVMLHLLVAIILSQQDPPTFDQLFPKSPPPEIVSVRKVSESESTIKLCQSFTALFQITLAGDALRTQWAKIARTASTLIRINGHEYKNMLSEGSTNEACGIDLLWPEPVGPEAPQRSASTALIAAACQIDCKSRACLFREPGDYRLEFFFGDQTLETTVHVSAATSAEQDVMKTLSTIPMLLLLADPTDPQYATPKNIATLEGLLAVPTDYSEMLSLTIGVAKGRRVGRPLWSDLTDPQKREELEQRLALLSPVQPKDLNTRLAGLAASELVHVTEQLARLENDAQRRSALAGTREKVLRKLADCPFIPREQASPKARTDP